MRALLPLLAAAAAAAAAGAPALLVLRAACLARDPAAFRPRAPPGRALRVLPYAETCGPDWSLAVTRESLAAMSGGGVVAVAGWPGAAACGALSAAARALHRARPAACGAAGARAAAVAALAARRGWRRAVLPRPAPGSECGAALQEVARALAAAGLTAVSALPPASDDLQSHVVILCASREGRPAGAGEALVAAAGAVLLLHVEEPAPVGTGAAPSTRTDDTFRLSNIDLVVDRVLYVSGKESSMERNVETSVNTFRRKSDFWAASKFNNISRTKRTVTFSEESKKDANDLSTLKEKENSSQNENSNSSTDLIRDRRSDYLFTYIDKSFPRGNLLLLSDERLDENRIPRDLEQVYADALEALERATSAESTRIEVAEFTFHLYRRSQEKGLLTAAAWSLVGSVATRSSRSLDDTQEWETEVVAVNATDAFSQVLSPRAEGERRAGAGAGAAVLWAGGGVALAAAAALAARWVAARRRRRRRGGDAVLAPAHFTFPADERRCVGEGMETMLSCWLQQLHEFGGPELERPDLLKQPRVPSVPSSTCSVNRIAFDRRIRYKGDAVQLKPLLACPAGEGAGDGGPLDLKRKAIDVLLVMQSLRHENLNPFIGLLNESRPALVWDHCGRGSLEDVLMADDIKLDWTFRLSLLTDLVKGMRYLHGSPLRVHGRLSSRSCAVDSRWVLRVSEFGRPALARAQLLPEPRRAARDLLWTAPELLREPAARADQPADVYSFAIVMQEVIVRGEPYCMLALTPDEIVEKLSRPPPLIRPSVSMGAAPPEAVSVMRQCWSEAPDLRPDFHRLHDLFRHLHRGRKINIVDSMFEMLEKYSNNLEELIRERTEQLDMEKKKTEQLLNRMLPRSVAERLLLGSRVEPEEFSDVSIYFSDIVGFTALAARSTPVQVVDLLNDLYTTFDAAIERYRVYKVETIGDAYMVVGGLPTRARDHAESVATMALHLLHLAGRFRVRHLPDTPLHLRIGLHSGPCCAAVVGLTMPRYCLFGDTVNTASRMESTGAAWRIQVSASTADRLAAAGGYRLRSRGLIMIKGKGAMHTYWLLGKEGFDKPLPTPPPLESEDVLYETDGENDSEPSSGPPSAAAAAPTSVPAPVLILEPLETDANRCEQGRLRSGAVSADSSPPPAVVGAPYSRYRWAGAGRGAGRGAGSLRRQWSLERGEALATAAAAPARAPPRYRTRPGPPDEPP